MNGSELSSEIAQLRQRIHLALHKELRSMHLSHDAWKTWQIIIAHCNNW